VQPTWKTKHWTKVVCTGWKSSRFSLP
jgi:hypothetical protein